MPDIEDLRNVISVTLQLLAEVGRADPSEARRRVAIKTLTNPLALALAMVLALVGRIDGRMPSSYLRTAEMEWVRAGAFELFFQGWWIYKGWTLHMQRARDRSWNIRVEQVS